VAYARTGNLKKGETLSVSFTTLRFPCYPESDMGECSLKGGCICSTHGEGIGTARGPNWHSQDGEQAYSVGDKLYLVFFGGGGGGGPEGEGANNR
jgi:hypothetical protein